LNGSGFKRDGKIGEDGSDGAVAIDAVQEAAALVIGDDWLGLGAVLGEAVGEGFETVIGAAGEWASATGAGGGGGETGVGAESAAAGGANEAVGDAVADDRFIDEEENREINGGVLAAEHRVEGICLADGAGVAVKNPGAVMGGEPLADDLDRDLVRDKEAALEVVGGAEADRGAGSLLLAEHGAHGGSLEPESLF
jgi:hypothetical protein